MRRLGIARAAVESDNGTLISSDSAATEKGRLRLFRVALLRYP